MEDTFPLEMVGDQYQSGLINESDIKNISVSICEQISILHLRWQIKNIDILYLSSDSII